MISQELRAMSLDYRRISSNLLNASTDDANVMLLRFKKFIDESPFITDLLSRVMAGIIYSYKDCFITNKNDWDEMAPPVDEASHIKAQYDYLTYLCDKSIDVLNAAMGYYHSSGKYIDIIRDFIHSSFKPLIDYINNAISKEMIILEEQIQNQSTAMVQNFNAPLYGTAVQGTGVINSHNTTIANDITEIIQLVNKVIGSVNALNIAEEIKEDVKDDLEVVLEQVNSTTPKKSRLQKALGGIKKFMSDFIRQLAVTGMVNAVTKADWASLVERIEMFISRLL
jgi:hypothetical protein